MNLAEIEAKAAVYERLTDAEFIFFITASYCEMSELEKMEFIQTANMIKERRDNT